MSAPTKIPAISITLTRLTGPAALCHRRTVFTGPECWTQVNEWLRAMVPTFHETDCDGHDFVVEFADHETYTGRLDCSRTENLDIGSHIERNASSFKLESGERFLDIYEIGSAKSLPSTRTAQQP